jgi:hypothetical protein
VYDANIQGVLACPIAQCTIAHRMIRAESVSLAHERFGGNGEELGLVRLSADNAPVPVIELENRKCAMD